MVKTSAENAGKRIFDNALENPRSTGVFPGYCELLEELGLLIDFLDYGSKEDEDYVLREMHGTVFKLTQAMPIIMANLASHVLCFCRINGRLFNKLMVLKCIRKLLLDQIVYQIW